MATRTESRTRTKGVRLTREHHTGLNLLACVTDTTIQALADQAFQEFIERQSVIYPAVAEAAEKLKKTAA